MNALTTRDKSKDKPRKPSASVHTVRAKDGGTVALTVNKSKAIALKCTECMGFETHPSECTSLLCPLFAYRKLTKAAYHSDVAPTA